MSDREARLGQARGRLSMQSGGRGSLDQGRPWDGAAVAVKDARKNGGSESVPEWEER